MSHKILAIDDHPQTLDIVVTTLKRFGYQVVSSLSPLEGLRLAQETLPDLVLLDVNMPDMDGLEVCRRLRADQQLATVPIIMFTAEDEPQQKLAGFEAGADDYLTKPTDPEEMIARIEGILGSNVAAEEAEEQAPMDALYSEETVVIPSGKDRLVIAPSLSSRLIAVLGARGGAGSTLTAINLAASLARWSCPTTLVDLDMVQGHIALYLNQRVTGGINTLADVPDEEIGQWLPQQLVNLSQHLQLLLTHPNYNGRYPHLTASQITVIMDRLLQSGQTIVADLGHTLSEAQRQVLEMADQILLCLPPERVALSAAKQRLSQLQKDIHPYTSLNAIVFDVGGQMNLPRKAVETFLEYPLQTVITIHPDKLTQSVNKGSILIGTYPQSKTAKQFYKLAKQYIQT